jgi:hypothetical protein
MIRAAGTRLNILSVLAAGSLALGCGSDGDKGNGNGNGDGKGGNNQPPTGEENLKLTFSPMYSAYIDEDHDFKLPVIMPDAPGKIEFTAADPSMVEIVRTGDASAMLKMKKAGDTIIYGAAENGDFGKADLHITQATKEELELGQERYENGVEAFVLPEGGFMLPEGGFMIPDGGFMIPDGGFRFDAGIAANPESACTFCHKPDGAGGGAGSTGGIPNLDVEHTPQQIGGYSDEDLLNIFTKGKKPEGVPMRIAMGRLAQTWEMTHQWQMEESAKKGIIVYIRSLEPKPQGEVDFLGGLIRGLADAGFVLPEGGFGSLFGDGGFMFPRRDAGGGGATDAAAPAEDASGGETDAGTDAGTDMDAGT